MSRMFFICFSYRLHIVPHLDFWELSICFFFFRFCFLTFACVAAFLVSAVFLCFHSILCLRLQLFLDFSMISWYLFSSSGFSSPVFFSVWSPLSCFVVSSLSFKFLRWPSFFGVVIMNVATTHLWSLPTRIMSLASASLLYFKCLLLIVM